jgi:hypothetical protein
MLKNAGYAIKMNGLIFAVVLDLTSLLMIIVRRKHTARVLVQIIPDSKIAVNISLMKGVRRKTKWLAG